MAKQKRAPKAEAPLLAVHQFCVQSMLRGSGILACRSCWWAMFGRKVPGDT